MKTSVGLAAIAVTAALTVVGCQHEASSWDSVLDAPTMETVSHRYLQPQRNVEYIPEARVRRRLPARDIVIDERIADDVNFFGSAWADELVWRAGPEAWGEITHIGLSTEGDIRMINVAEGGQEIPLGELAPQFEVFVIQSNHPRYSLALSRVLMLLPGLRPGAGVVRLTPPTESPWPFFDCDVVAAPVYFQLEETNEGRSFRLVSGATAIGLGESRFIEPLPSDANSVATRVDWVSWERTGDILLVDADDRLVRVPTSHPLHSAVLSELRRTIPGLRRGSGFLLVLFSAPSPWPFAPIERAVDEDIVRRIADGTWYVREQRTPPPMPSPSP